MAEEINDPLIGMKFLHPSLLKDGEYSLLVNGNIGTILGDFQRIASEPSNILCSKFKDGYKVIGIQSAISLNISFFFLVNPDGGSEIGIINHSFRNDSNDIVDNCGGCNKPLLPNINEPKLCTYTTYVNADCLNFSFDHPIKSWLKVDDCNVRIYFTDDYNPPRYIDYSDFPKQEVSNCPKVTNEELDCDKIKIFKDSCSPDISYIDVVSGGENTAGVYQFGIAYADAYSNPITNYFYFPNKIDLWDKNKTILVSQDTAYPISKSIKLEINGINSNFDWFNLIVLKTINGVTTPKLIETFSNTGSSFTYTYSGIDKNVTRPLSIDEVLKKTPIYELGKIITQSNGINLIGDVSEPRILNLQPFINKLPVNWISVELNEGDYANPIIASKYTSFLRDESYALAIEFGFTNTNRTARSHIPGRPSTSYDLDDVSLLGGLPNPDVFSSSSCETTSGYVSRWSTYNTGAVSGYACGYSADNNTSQDVFKTETVVCYSPNFWVEFGAPLPCDEEPCPPTLIFWNRACNEDARIKFNGYKNTCSLPGSSAYQCVQDILNQHTDAVITSTSETIEYTGAISHCLTHEARRKCTFKIKYKESSGNCDSTLTAFVSCLNPTIFYRDHASGDFYLNYDSATNTLSTPIADPCSYPDFKCLPISADCLDYIESIYPEHNPITSATCSVFTVQNGGTRIKYTYNTAGDPVSVPSYPYPPNTQSTPTNISCLTAITADTTCNAQTLVSLEDSGGGTTTLWYSFYAPAEVKAITVSSVYNQTDGNTFTLTLYDTSDGYCSGVTVPILTVTQANPFFFIDNLTVGSTYFYTINGNSNVNAGVNDFYYICCSDPIPISSEIQDLPDTVRVKCEYEVNYCVKYDKCTAIPYQYGTFGYIESTEKYPCNPEIWGDLANTPIRHHKFPDCLTSPHYRNINSGSLSNPDLFRVKNKIYPIGLQISVEDIKNLLVEAQTSGHITEEERLSICSYRILRSNRRGNESIISKGLLYDVWQYTDNVYKTNKPILYPNYPYNDRFPDQFNLTTKLENTSSLISPISHPYSAQNSHGAISQYRNNRYNFIGANTLFNNPGLGTEVKLEMESFGVSEGRYTEVINHPKYQYAGIGAVRAAYCLSSLESVFDTVATVNAGGVISAAIISSLSSLLWGSRIPGHYYDWLDIIRKLAPFRNFAYYHTSIGNYSDFVTKDSQQNRVIAGNIRRGLNDGEYLRQGVFTVASGADRLKFNNYKRESSVYLNLNQVVDSTLSDPRDYFTATSISDTSRWYPGDGTQGTGTCSNPTLGDVYRPISSYYSSLKNSLPNQYGQIDQIEYIDTGYFGKIIWGTTQDTTCDPIFGGDTYINRFSVRKQLPFFIQDTVGQAPNTDIQYNELSNIGYPQFYFSYPQGAVMTTLNINNSISQLYGDVALNNEVRRDYNFSCPKNLGQGIFFMALQALGLSNSLISGNIIAGAGALITNVQIFNTFGDLSNQEVYPGGKFFLYSYGEPSFITESNYNLDLRYGVNFKEGNFYPYLGDMVEWTQPTAQFNLINYDNTYYYNADYSKQNKENLGYILNQNFNQSKEDCKVLHSNRVVYSIQDNDNNDRFDGNLVFLANNYYDFPKAAGKLKILKGLDNNKVLVIQEDQATVFNAYNTLEADIKQVAVGAGALFQQQFQQFIKSDIGYAGSQTSAIITTEYGTYWADNKRGDIFNLTQGISSIIDESEQQWFRENLPFKILNYFPTIDIDNPYKGCGMNIWWDKRFKRVFFSKKDYIPKNPNITFTDNKFYLDNTEVFLTDTSLFCNNSFTIAYSPIAKNFISFYSFIPDYTNSLNDYFQTGINSSSNYGVYNHLLTMQDFGRYYGATNPLFLIEYSTKYSLSSKILSSISYRDEFRRYTDNSLNYSLNNHITFNKAILYNQFQTTGQLNLVVQQPNNSFQLLQYPKQSLNSTDLLVANTENIWHFNGFTNVGLQNNNPIMTYQCNPAYKDINLNAISYAPTYYKDKLRSDFFNIRFINDVDFQHQIVIKPFSNQDINSPV